MSFKIGHLSNLQHTQPSVVSRCTGIVLEKGDMRNEDNFKDGHGSFSLDLRFVCITLEL